MSKGEFIPTYLMIKQHSVTGLSYFCKTTKTGKQMLNYLGSGKYWKKHIKKHGKEYVETIWYCLYYNKDELIKFALMCSEQWDIVKSDEWANLVSENGIDGNSVGTRLTEETKIKIRKRRAEQVMSPQSPEERRKRSIALKGIKKGPQSPEERRKRSIALKGIKKGPQSLEHRLNNSKSQKGIAKGPQCGEHIEKRAAANRGKIRTKITCPHCQKEGGAGIMRRWHFNNCKQRNTA